MGLSLKSIGSKISHAAKSIVTHPLKAAENIGRSVGGTVAAAAPALNLIPGVGPIAAAGLGALGSVAAGNNLKTSLKTGIIGGGAGLLGAAGSAVKALPGASSIPGLSSISSILGGAKNAVNGVLTKIPGVSQIESALGGGSLDKLKAAARAMNGGKPITLGTVGDLLKKGGTGLLNHPELAATGLSAYSGYKDAARASQLEDSALNRGNAAYAALNAHAPLEDLSSIYADPGNPYAQMKRIRLSSTKAAA